MTPQDPKTRAKELADAHWEYVEGILKTHDISGTFIKVAKHHYLTAAVHFHGHGVEDERNRLFYPRIGSPLTPEEIADIAAITPSGCQNKECKHWDLPAPCNCTLHGMAGSATCKFYADPDDVAALKAVMSIPSAVVKDGADNCANYDPKTCVDCYHCDSYERDGLRYEDEDRLTLDLTPIATPGPLFDLVQHLHRQRAFSLNTFGPGNRTAGVLDHIRKELKEIEADPADLFEWVDLVLLSLDGAWRAGHTPEAIAAGIEAKQTRNEGRVWPDWRTADPDKAIEHDRTGETSSPLTATLGQ